MTPQPCSPANALADVISGRRSVRAYNPTPVDADTISELLAAAVQAPSAMNGQPWGFSIVQDRARLKLYSDRAKALLLAAISDPKSTHYVELLGNPEFNIFYDAGTLVAISVDAPGPYVDADCWLAAQNFNLAAHARGLGTCCIGFAVGVLNLPDVKQELGVASGGRVIAPLILGEPRGPTPVVPRRPPRVLAWLR